MEKWVWELAVRLSRSGHTIHLCGIKFWTGNDVTDRDGVTLHGVCPAQELNTDGRRIVQETISFSFALFLRMCEDTYENIACQQFSSFSCIAAK
ncbi:MAG: hypothetical protein WCF90_09515 [Methanomicrobiales archaeon]